MAENHFLGIFEGLWEVSTANKSSLEHVHTCGTKTTCVCVFAAVPLFFLEKKQVFVCTCASLGFVCMCVADRLKDRMTDDCHPVLGQVSLSAQIMRLNRKGCH